MGAAHARTAGTSVPAFRKVMPPHADLKRGDFVLCNCPFNDTDERKMRNLLVLGITYRNGEPYVNLMYATSKGDKIPLEKRAPVYDDCGLPPLGEDATGRLIFTFLNRAKTFQLPATRDYFPRGLRKTGSIPREHVPAIFARPTLH